MPRGRRKTKKEERDNRPGLALEKPRLPTPPGRCVRSAEVNPSDRCQARASGSHWLASGAPSENFLPSGGLPAGRTRTAVATCAADAPAPTGAGRCRRVASMSRNGRRCAESAVRRRTRRSAWRRLRDQDHNGAGRRSRTGRPTTCSTSAPVEFASSLQPLARAVATRCGTAPKPRRRSDEAPPWQLGPAGRRDGTERKERRVDDMGRAFVVPRGGNISLQ